MELARARQNEAAIEEFNVAIRLNPKNAKAYCGRGTAKSELDLDSDAMADFDEAVRLSPYDFRAWALRGMEKARYGHYDLAIADYHEAIRLNPNHEEANLGLNYIKTHGIHDLVMADILREDPSADVIFFPQGAQDYIRRGRVLLLHNFPTMAILDFDEAIRLESNFAGVYLMRGLLRSLLRRV